MTPLFTWSEALDLVHSTNVLVIAKNPPHTYDYYFY